MTFEKFFVIFDRIDVDGTEPADLLFDAGNVFFDLLKIIELFFFVRKRVIWSDLILFPHVGDPSFPLFFDLFCLTAQTETFFVQKCGFLRKTVSFFKKCLVAFGSLFLLCLAFLSLYKKLFVFFAAVFDRFFEVLDAAFFSGDLISALGETGKQVLGFPFKSLDL